jgi:hypothetical protein
LYLCGIIENLQYSAEGQEHNRITIRKKGSQGIMEVKVRLSLISAPPVQNTID